MSRSISPLKRGTWIDKERERDIERGREGKGKRENYSILVFVKNS